VIASARRLSGLAVSVPFPAIQGGEFAYVLKITSLK
jgi:hypothetical protein